MSNPLLNSVPGEVIVNVNEICGKLFNDSCCTKFIYNLDLSDEECIKLFIVKLLGYGIIVLGSIVKLPQVFKIFGARSGVGISVFGALLELMAITFNSCYSYRNKFALSAWGESISLAIETALIVFMVLWFSGNKSGSLLFLLCYPGIVNTLIHPTLVSKDIMLLLQISVLPLAVSGKLLQAFKNYKSQHTGQLSALTAWAIFAGSITRIITSYNETDGLTTLTFACSSLANAVIAVQVLWYWKLTQKFFEKAKKKKAN